MMKRDLFGVFVLAVVLVSCLTASPALAIEPTALTDKQITLNNQATELLRMGDAENISDGVALTYEALSVGPRFDILLLTAARGEQLLDNCSVAIALFNEIDTSPNDPRLSRDDILARRDQYVQQIPEKCSGHVVFECAEPDIAFRLGARSYACGERAKLRGGVHAVSASKGAVEKVYDVQVSGGQDVILAPKLEDFAAASYWDARGHRPLMTTGAIASVVGVAAIVSGTLLMNRSSTRAQALERLRPANALLAAGIGGVVFGATVGGVGVASPRSFVDESVSLPARGVSILVRF